MNNKGLKLNKNTALKFILPVLLVCGVLIIWIAKNSSKGTEFVSSSNPDFELHVTEEIDLEKLKSYGLPIIIDFGADSCIPCKKMAPVLKELNEELRGKAIIKFVDVWKYQELTQNYPISIIPTQIFIDSKGNPYSPIDTETIQMKFYSRNDTGEHVFTSHEGGMDKEQLQNILKEMGMK